MKHQLTPVSKITGLSLIEVLIALVLGLILTGSVVQLLISSNNAFRMQNALARVQDNGQFATEYLINNIRNVDYWGCLSDTTWINNHLNNAASNDYYRFDSGLQGTANQASGGTIVASTDTITVSTVSAVSGLNNVIMPYAANTAAPVVTNSSTSLAQGSIVLVSDCLAGDIFQVTNADASSGSLQHATGIATPGNNSALLSKIYSTGAFVYLPQTNTYSIQMDASNVPGLFVTTASGSQELLDNVENMLILYGEDTDADGAANRYVRANQVSNMDNVVSVRISLVVRTAEDNIVITPQSYLLNAQLITPTDNRLRRVYTTTITLRNRVE